LSTGSDNVEKQLRELADKFGEARMEIEDAKESGGQLYAMRSCFKSSFVGLVITRADAKHTSCCSGDDLLQRGYGSRAGAG
jgi:hypothetical protein